MSEITQNNYVIVTRNFGVFYVSEAQANSLNSLFDLPDSQRPYRIEVEKTKIVMSDVVGITTAAKYDEIQRKKRGEWQCSSKNWHDKFEKCQCGWGMDTKKRESKLEETLTPEQRKRTEVVKKLREKGMTMKDFFKHRKKSTAELEELLSTL